MLRTSDMRVWKDFGHDVREVKTAGVTNSRVEVPRVCRAHSQQKHVRIRVPSIWALPFHHLECEESIYAKDRDQSVLDFAPGGLAPCVNEP